MTKRIRLRTIRTRVPARTLSKTEFQVVEGNRVLGRYDHLGSALRAHPGASVPAALNDRQAAANRRKFDCVEPEHRCNSPLACDGFGYCRTRNFDGAPMTEAKAAARLRAESDAAYAAARKSQ